MPTSKKENRPAHCCEGGEVPGFAGDGDIGAGSRDRTGDIELGKIALCQLSYARKSI